MLKPCWCAWCWLVVRQSWHQTGNLLPGVGACLVCRVLERLEASASRPYRAAVKRWVLAAVLLGSPVRAGVPAGAHWRGACVQTQPRPRRRSEPLVSRAVSGVGRLSFCHAGGNRTWRVAALCNVRGCTSCTQRETKSGKNGQMLLGLPLPMFRALHAQMAAYGRAEAEGRSPAR